MKTKLRRMDIKSKVKHEEGESGDNKSRLREERHAPSAVGGKGSNLRRWIPEQAHSAAEEFN